MRTSWSDEHDRRAVDLRNAGATDAAIAGVLGRSRNSVQTRLSRLRGQGASMTSLMRESWSEERIVAVIRLLDEGATYGAIARTLGVSQECVRINVMLLRAEGRVPDPDYEDDVVLVPDGDPLLAALHREYSRGRSA